MKSNLFLAGRFVKSNSFPSNLSKEQKRMLFKMGVRSVSALKNIVLFFFHGVGGSSDIWQTQINYFSSLGFEIVAPDLIGHGMSEVPLKKRAYHFREILADVIAIFDRYCKKKNLVIGHSYGCAFTTVLARERARRVWRLIMISGGGPIPLAPEIGIFAFPLWFVSCVRPCLDQVFEK
ncbi:ABHD8 [Acanthosepion pharaonis]|uniref:acylglycerol lipase n=1 Tax=Acanthosepion pharaonis TaxID=158019 RepID=A0A812DR86_ACAPH|nr:ABHD8 [Sepia pharaonis]